MAAGAAAGKVGRYVRFAEFNCSLFIVHYSLPKSGAKIGKIPLSTHAQFSGIFS